MMSYNILILFIIILFIIIILTSTNYTKNYNILRQKMRKLWSDHVFWTREFLLATFLSPSNTNQMVAQTRLLQNQKDIGVAYGNYYNTDVSNTLSNLLTQHILIAVEL